LAIDMGADYIEADLVPTKDNYLVSRHDSGPLELVTNIEEFPDFIKRKKIRSIYGYNISGCFTEDFTLAELKMLKANEYFTFRNQQFNNLFQILTFQEVIQFVRAKELEKKRSIGLYVETKDSKYFSSIGLPLETEMIKILEANNYNSSNHPVFIQSFEANNLKALRKEIKFRY